MSAYFKTLLISALLPGLILMLYIFKKDRLEKEPKGLLWKLLLFGALFSFVPAILENIGDRILDGLFPRGGRLYYALDAFVVVALSEEGMKRFVLKRKTWSSPSFNCSFDGIVYAAYVSLGFACLENLIYVFGSGVAGGLSTAMARAFTAIPAHFFNAVFMGLYYGRAKECELKGDAAGRDFNMGRSLLVPVLLHGAYDYLAFVDTAAGNTAFTVLLIGLYFFSFRTIRRESAADRYLTGPLEW